MDHLSEDQLWQIVSREIDDKQKEAHETHLSGCDQCTRELHLFTLMESDLKSFPVPDASEGFALRVAAQVRREQEYKIFDLPSFRIFRFGLAASFVLIFFANLFLLAGFDAKINLPPIPGGSYMVLAVVVVMIVFVADRIISKKLT
ncbi:MAG TPA: hypothetical protein P5280_16915 [Cyclobacteriaceae bacterium]|nr:hypothetical protein [Cyclobacteriaceae bacterium]